jgi:hypothetical protein
MPKTTWVVLITLLSPALVKAEYFKCVDKDGKITVTNTDCPGGTSPASKFDGKDHRSLKDRAREMKEACYKEYMRSGTRYGAKDDLNLCLSDAKVELYEKLMEESARSREKVQKMLKEGNYKGAEEEVKRVEERRKELDYSTRGW